MDTGVLLSSPSALSRTECLRLIGRRLTNSCLRVVDCHDVQLSPKSLVGHDRAFRPGTATRNPARASVVKAAPARNVAAGP